MKAFAVALVDRLNIGLTQVRVGAVKYAGDAFVEFYLNTYSRKSDITNHLRDLELLGTKTYTGLGLRYMRNEIFQPMKGDRDRVPNIAIVITDGKSNINEEETKAEADLAKGQGIRMIAVGITDNVNPTELRDIASDDQSLFVVENFEILMQQLDDIARTTCQPSDDTTKGRTVYCMYMCSMLTLLI